MAGKERMGNQNRFVIGVTGHRKISQDTSLAEAVRSAIAGILEKVGGDGGTTPELVVLSALAEGADRLVAREALKFPGARLEVVLPMSRDDYERDFQKGRSKAEFEALLDRAVHIEQLLPEGTRDETYERAGQYVVDHCDLLVALWDGRPAAGQGGTGDIVRYARERKRPLLWIYPDKPAKMTFEPEL